MAQDAKTVRHGSFRGGGFHRNRDEQRRGDAIITHAVSNWPQRLSHRAKLNRGQGDLGELRVPLWERRDYVDRPRGHLSLMNQPHEQAGAKVGRFESDVVDHD
jgi:hypothetical protein